MNQCSDSLVEVIVCLKITYGQSNRVKSLLSVLAPDISPGRRLGLRAYLMNMPAHHLPTVHYHKWTNHRSVVIWGWNAVSDKRQSTFRPRNFQANSESYHATCKLPASLTHHGEPKDQDPNLVPIQRTQPWKIDFTRTRLDPTANISSNRATGRMNWAGSTLIPVMSEVAGNAQAEIGIQSPEFQYAARLGSARAWVAFQWAWLHEVPPKPSKQRAWQHVLHRTLNRWNPYHNTFRGILDFRILGFWDLGWDREKIYGVGEGNTVHWWGCSKPKLGFAKSIQVRVRVSSTRWID